MTAPYPQLPDQPGYYGPPPAGQWAPGYGAPPGYGGHGPAGAPPRPRAANPIGIVLAMVGGVTVLLSSLVDWYNDVRLETIVAALDADGAKAFPAAYFGWLMWVLLAATVVAALFANLPHGAAVALRIISPILGVLGAALLLVGLNELLTNGSVFDRSAAGLYLALLGFVVAGVGGVLGPRSERFT